MKTYETYQEAKIANPESEIYENDDGEFGTRNQLSKVVGQYVLCNSSDYCITVEKFLSDGYKFVEGDICLGGEGRVYTLISYTSNLANRCNVNNDKQYVLRAAALETEHQQEMEELKPKRTRVEYEKVTNATSGDDLFLDDDGCKIPCLVIGWHPLQPLVVIERGEEIGCVMMSDLYRKVEVEIDEKSFVMDLLDDGTQDTPYVEFHGLSMIIDGGISIKEMRAITDALDDDGKFKQVRQ